MMYFRISYGPATGVMNLILYDADRSLIQGKNLKETFQFVCRKRLPRELSIILKNIVLRKLNNSEVTAKIIEWSLENHS